MENVTSISIIMATARDNYALIGHPKIHMLKPTIDSLKTQSFKDFEVIIIDSLYNKRPNLFNGDPFNSSKLLFRVKHVPVHKNHTFWLDRCRWSVCGQLNTGIIHSQGDLIVRIDDCCEFDSQFIQKFWDGYQSGYFPGAMHLCSNEPPVVIEDAKRDDVLKVIYGQDCLARDARYEIVKNNGGRIVGPYNWHCGYSSMSLEAALKINGLDENFDGDKSLEDIDCGSRIEMAGYKDKFIMDVDHQVIEHGHNPVSGLKGSTSIKCNYALLQLNRLKKRYRVNSDKLIGKDIDFIRETSSKLPCAPEGEKHSFDLTGDLFETWMFRQPIFNLKDERKKILEEV
jgi:glycosyltransferase involved in cell wall biosynthesis